VYNTLVVLDLLHLDPHPAFTGGSAPHDVSNDIELALAFGGEGEPFRGVAEELGSDFGGRVRVPVVGLLGTADDGAAV
jgi:hypothetical protein